MAFITEVARGRSDEEIRIAFVKEQYFQLRVKDLWETVQFL